MTAEKTVLAGLLPEMLHAAVEKALREPVPKFRSSQICSWINSGAFDFAAMKNLPRAMREQLEKTCAVFSSTVSAALNDRDGTQKIQITLNDGCKIEAVILHDGKGRKTACLSTQAGCACACAFCKTGSLGFKRNLSSGEMAEEFLFLRQRDPDISHIVIMGMGEPLFNLGELRKAVEFFTHKEGLGISRKRITVSTAGIVEGILDLAENGPDTRLALSLTSARQQLREELMPIAKTNPLPALKQSLLRFQNRYKDRVTLEAVLLKGINTGEDEAAAMAGFAKGLDAVINLIPWNRVDGLEQKNILLETPGPDEVNRFVSMLEKRRLKVTLRMGKGREISGACGQLG